MRYIEVLAKGHKGSSQIKIPVVDVRESDEEREIARIMIKNSNGNRSQFIPPRYAGALKY